jgi:hypothetical protein
LPFLLIIQTSRKHDFVTPHCSIIVCTAESVDVKKQTDVRVRVYLWHARQATGVQIDVFQGLQAAELHWESRRQHQVVWPESFAQVWVALHI